jgi:hypothetical protein
MNRHIKCLLQFINVNAGSLQSDICQYGCAVRVSFRNSLLCIINVNRHPNRKILVVLIRVTMPWVDTNILVKRILTYQDSRFLRNVVTTCHEVNVETARTWFDSKNRGPWDKKLTRQWHINLVTCTRRVIRGRCTACVSFQIILIV